MHDRHQEKPAVDRRLTVGVAMLGATLNASTWCALINLMAGQLDMHRNIVCFGLIALVAGIGAILAANSQE